jgi:Putative peptidoglycan-binding domain-containing protein
MDTMVLATQQWLNTTYTGRTGYSPITEDGQTGGATFGALIRALQLELGNLTVDGVFGTSTINRMNTVYPSPKISSSNPASTNVNKIIQGSLYCKGYNPNGFDGTFGTGTTNAVKSFESDAGITQDGIVKPYILQGIMNTDSYAMRSNGDGYIHQVQVGLNTNYGATIGLTAPSGVWDRNSQKNLIKACQIEWGKTVDGVYGTDTMNAAPVLSVNTSGYTNSKRLLQYALDVNGFYPGGFTGTFGTGTQNAVKAFQTFVGLTSDGVAGKQTWASLMKSCDDPSRTGKACDTCVQLTQGKANAIAAAGYQTVGRYLTNVPGGLNKRLVPAELDYIQFAGLQVFPIYETYGDSTSYFSAAQGEVDWRLAETAAKVMGFPQGTIIYFAVDYDASDSDIADYILPYFEGLNAEAGSDPYYEIAVYGPRSVCHSVENAEYSVNSFVSDMSSGWSGNLGYSLPSDWAYDQISTITVGTGDNAIEIDNCILSGRSVGTWPTHMKPYCGAPDDYTNLLNHNMQVINGHYVCTTCGYEDDDDFPYCGGLEHYTDLSNHHMEIIDGHYVCSICGYQDDADFPYCGGPAHYTDLSCHQMEVSNGHYVCSICGYQDDAGFPYCGGIDYFYDVSMHNWKITNLFNDRRYICNTCGYEVKLPSYQEVVEGSLLQGDDAFIVPALITAAGIFAGMRVNNQLGTAPQSDEEFALDHFYYPEALLYSVDKIRSNNKYAFEYEYMDHFKNCAKEFESLYQGIGNYVPAYNFEIRKLLIENEAIKNQWNGILESIIDEVGGLILTEAAAAVGGPVGWAIGAYELINDILSIKSNPLGVIAAALEYIPEFSVLATTAGLMSSAYNVSSSIDQNLLVGDTMINIFCQRSADDINIIDVGSHIITVVFDSAKKIKYCIVGKSHRPGNVILVTGN